MRSASISLIASNALLLASSVSAAPEKSAAGPCSDILRAVEDFATEAGYLRGILNVGNPGAIRANITTVWTMLDSAATDMDDVRNSIAACIPPPDRRRRSPEDPAPSLCDKLTAVLESSKGIAVGVADLVKQAPASLDLDGLALTCRVEDAQLRLQSAIPGLRVSGVCPKEASPKVIDGLPQSARKECSPKLIGGSSGKGR